MRLVRELRSHIQYKIILPFLLLTLLVALAGSAVSIYFITSSAQERLNNQLAQVARETGDSLVGLERANLQFLREMVFAGANPGTGAPAVADAFVAGDRDSLAAALEPFFLVSTQRQGIRVDRLIAFDAGGRSIVDWEYQPGADGARRTDRAPRDIQPLWFVTPVLSAQSDALGDKYAGLLDLGDSDTRYLFSVAPVLSGNQVVGGLIVATRLDTVLLELSRSSSSAIVTVYRPDDGGAFASTQVPAAGLDSINIRQSLIEPIRDTQVAEQQAIFDTVLVNERAYQFAYVPLRVRGSLVALLSVALASDYVTGPWSAAGVPLMVLTLAFMLALIGLGIFIARQITRPLQELVSTAQAVTGGDLRRRSNIRVADEVGILARSFNEMTEHLVDLYGAVQAESSQRAAIVESITDGVVVCDPLGDVLVVNRATRELLGLADDQPPPGRFGDIPLRPLDEAALAFGEARTPDLFNLRDQIVRVAAAPVKALDGALLGSVYVLQDLTSEVAIDRAKTNFIATISHELRTPLTVLNGSSELLLRGLAGNITEEQRVLIESMRSHAQMMTGLLNNVIIVAGLEAGTLTLEVEPVELKDVLDDLLWSVRPPIAAKGLKLNVQLPSDLPELLADAHQLRTVLTQLIDNARRYTEAGSITVQASCEGSLVRVDVADTGRGISPELSEHLFTRFTRGAEGINSAERGIGLGLAISKMLLERQGGTIWLAETSDQGSTFSFTLPCIHADPRSHNSVLATAA